jgi:histidine ammonia-lyase
MGTIAARDCLRVLELTEQVAAALLITVLQGVWLRRRLDPARALPAPLARMLDLLAADVEPVTEDRRLDPELHLLLGRIRDQAWSLYA